MKAYKLFRIKNGKLYPLYVFANEEVPMGVRLDAKAGELSADADHSADCIPDRHADCGMHQ